MRSLNTLVPMGAVIVGLGLLSGCAGAAASATPAPSTRRLAETDAGSAIALRVGDRLEITLPGNPTTGYQWEVGSGNAAVLRPNGAPQFAPDSQTPGSGGRVTLAFDAVSAGQTRLKLIYHRPFEANVAPLKTFEVTVAVK